MGQFLHLTSFAATSHSKSKKVQLCQHFWIQKHSVWVLDVHYCFTETTENAGVRSSG